MVVLGGDVVVAGSVLVVGEKVKVVVGAGAAGSEVVGSVVLTVVVTAADVVGDVGVWVVPLCPLVLSARR
jgi:hypothetical protein